MADEIRILVVDDHPLLREGVVSTLNSDKKFTVVGAGGSYDDAMQLAPQLMPDIVLLDVSMPGGGVNAARDLHEAIPVIKIIMLTVSEDEKDVMSALKAGASGYILKGVSGTELIKIVNNIQSGETYITPSLATNLLVDSYESESPSEDSVLMKELNEKERDILNHLSHGLTNKEIAAKIFLSEKTVKHYMTNILQKLQVKNRVEAALLIQRNNFQKQ